ncbi:Trimethylamine methyltransferase (MTTB) [Pelagimonas phthalicica]|uniref:Methyltransferase n=1 Tax=Pelagimonas phthalicica TaxID=1037362 RepID=A0A238JHE0_9RHOB|nr:trimethylamine methyltransferase family protein [Pelagimonas phthalicica]TDS92311.1 trimethylamine--corrinoid protein Co-methyltransferase [Pelagimonas phthalicica]SMX29372.1 Trimethylamine methyltransferase (MTTB) [Pelagimonas phthalicica]
MTQSETVTTGRRRGGGRRGTAARRGLQAVEQAPWVKIKNRDRPTEPLRPEEVERVHDATMRVLEEIGIEFLNPEAVKVLKEAGCEVRGENVRMDRELVMELVGKAPDSFTVTPRNPDRQISLGTGHIYFGNVSSPPNYWDMEIGRKVPGTREFFRNLLKLSQYFNVIHFCGGYPVEPVDLHPRVRHLDAVHDKLLLSDKAMHVYSLGKERVEDGMEMVRIANGLSHEEFEASPRMYTNINSTSPLKHDHPMLDGWMRMAARGQALVVTPFTLAGAMAPVTMSGAVVQSLAEALAAVVLAQAVRPGAPCMIGTFTSNVDMKTGAPAFGTPEYMRATQITGQMARFYGLPMRSSGVCAANVPDGQSMWETEHSLWAAIQSGTDMVYHAAGWLEGGLIASPEKFIMDCEVLSQIQRYMEPEVCDVSDDSLAVEAMREVGPNGHFFGIQHTQDRYETAFHQPFLSDWKNYEAWEAAGAIWTPERAHGIYKQILNEFEAPPLDVAIAEELAAFVDKRKEEGGAPTDF